jgi:deoxycytidylate deaminase
MDGSPIAVAVALATSSRHSIAAAALAAAHRLARTSATSSAAVAALLVGYHGEMSEQDIPIISVDATGTPPTITVGKGVIRHTIETTRAMCEEANALIARNGHAVATVRYPSGGVRQIVRVA